VKYKTKCQKKLQGRPFRANKQIGMKLLAVEYGSNSMTTCENTLSKAQCKIRPVWNELSQDNFTGAAWLSSARAA
jgi:exonuclease VII small subunit